MTEQRIPENIVVCLDTSRSMYKKDLPPNRLTCCITAIKALISKRFELDSLTAFAIIQFSDKAEKIIDFTSPRVIFIEIDLFENSSS